MKNWKTTSAGISAIVGGLVALAYAYRSKSLTPEVLTGSLTGILSGVGLMFAKDQNVTGGSVVQPSSPEAIKEKALESVTK